MNHSVNLPTITLHNAFKNVYISLAASHTMLPFSQSISHRNATRAEQNKSLQDSIPFQAVLKA